MNPSVTPTAHSYLRAPHLRRLRHLRFGGALALALVLAGCALKPPPTAPDAPADAPPGTPPAAAVPSVRLITAQTPVVRTYRPQGARHLYAKHARHIYKGKLPPLVYAVVVVETDIDAQGNVTYVGYSRTPSHAPEVPPKIAELIRAASPFPSPGRVGPHTYVDTWLWDRSGRFQLDTLTEGQLSR